MRYLGLDLGTKTLGVAITDESHLIARVLTVIRFNSEDYETASNEVLKIINEYKIAKIILGYPKNMDNSCGFASKRSLNFKNLLETKTNVEIILVDERLSTKEAENILIGASVRREKRKNIIDGISALLILETFLKQEENSNGKK